MASARSGDARKGAGRHEAYLNNLSPQQVAGTARPILDLLIRDVIRVPVLSLHHDVSPVTGEEVVLFTPAEPPLYGQAKNQ